MSKPIRYPLSPEFVVEPFLSGIRIDSFLSRHLRNYTPWRLHRMVCAGLVHADGLPAAGDHKVRVGQRITIQLVEPPDKLLPVSRLPLISSMKIRGSLLSTNRAGLICHQVGDFQADTLTNLLQGYLDEQTIAPGTVTTGHRTSTGSPHEWVNGGHEASRGLIGICLRTLSMAERRSCTERWFMAIRSSPPARSTCRLVAIRRVVLC